MDHSSFAHGDVRETRPTFPERQQLSRERWAHETESEKFYMLFFLFHCFYIPFSPPCLAVVLGVPVSRTVQREVAAPEYGELTQKKAALAILIIFIASAICLVTVFANFPDMDE